MSNRLTVITDINVKRILQVLHEAAVDIKSKFPSVLVEASGGVTEQNVTEFMGHHVDVISLGSVTQNYSVVNFSLKICAAQRDPLNPTVTSCTQ